MLINLNKRLNIQLSQDEKHVGYVHHPEGYLYFNKANNPLIYLQKEEESVPLYTSTEAVLDAFFTNEAFFCKTENKLLKFEIYEQEIKVFDIEEYATLEESETEIEPYQVISLAAYLVTAGYRSAGPFSASYTPVDLVGVKLSFTAFSRAYSGVATATVTFGSQSIFNEKVAITEENKNNLFTFTARAGTGNSSTDSAYVYIKEIDFDETNLVYNATTVYFSSTATTITADKDFFFSPKLSKIVVTPYSYSTSNLNYVNDVRLFLNNEDISDAENCLIKKGQMLTLKSPSGKVAAKAVALYKQDKVELINFKEMVIDKDQWFSISEDISTLFRPEYHAVLEDKVFSFLYNNSNQPHFMLRNFDGEILKFERITNILRRASANYFTVYQNKIYYAISSSLYCIDLETFAVTNFSVPYLSDSNYCAITDVIDGKMYAINNSSARRVLLDVHAKTSTNEANNFTTYGDLWIGQYGYWLYYYTKDLKLVKVNAETGEKVIFEEKVAATGTVILRDEVTRDIYIFAPTYNKRILMKEDKVETFTLPSDFIKGDLTNMHIYNGIIYKLHYATLYSLDVQTMTYDVNKGIATVSEAETFAKRLYYPICTGKTLLAQIETYCNSSYFRLTGSTSSNGDHNLSLIETVAMQDFTALEIKETIQAADFHTLSFKQNIYAKDYKDFVLGETIYMPDSYPITLKELIQDRQLLTLPLTETIQDRQSIPFELKEQIKDHGAFLLDLIETVYEKENQQLVLKEQAFASDFNTLLLKESVSAQEEVTLQALLTVYAKDNRTFDVKETIAAKENHSLPIALTVYAKEQIALTFKEQVYDQEITTLALKEVIEAAYETHQKALELKEKVQAIESSTLNLKELINASDASTMLLKETIKAYTKGIKTFTLKENIEPSKEKGSSCVYIIEVVTTESIMLLETVVTDASYKTRLIGFNRRVVQKRTNKE